MASSAAINDPRWWKEAIILQIWPMSYRDSDGDGVGDLRGAIGTLDYLKTLGIDCVWMSPMYASPQKDYGYDISNYEDIYPPYGTMHDMDEFIEGCRARGMKVLLDLVINHTSDQHPWFIESRKSRNNKYADWYIWKDPVYKDGVREPPNNWSGLIPPGSAWEWDETREQYYLHNFLCTQPDLNWENEDTRKAIYKSALEFWLEKGVSGFRVDTSNFYSKDQRFLDAPIVNPDEKYQPAIEYFVNGPRIHEFYQEMRREVLDRYEDVVLIGESLSPPGSDELGQFVSAARHELNCCIDWTLHSLGGRWLGSPYYVFRPRLPEFKASLNTSQNMIRGTDQWITTYLENHDQPRSVNRWATDDPKYREPAAKMLAMLLCCLSGTLLIYQGQELGMTNMPTSWGIEEYRDPFLIQMYEAEHEKRGGKKIWMDKILDGMRVVARDNARTPVQWSNRKNGGFTTGTPWIRVNDNYTEVNCMAQQEDVHSPLQFWSRMLQMRKDRKASLIYGNFDLHEPNDLDVFSFVKSSFDGKEVSVVYLNFSSQVQPISLPAVCREKGIRDISQMKLLAHSTRKQVPGEDLDPWEGRVYALE